MNAEDLVALLRKYNGPRGTANIQAILQSEQGNSLIEWAAAHLTSDTLLSADELQQFTRLENLGQAEQLAASGAWASVTPLDSHEVTRAIQELERSTEAIAKQTELLKQQQDALDKLVSSGTKFAHGRSSLSSQYAQRKKSQLDARRLAVEETAQNLQVRVSELEQQSSETRDVLRATVDTRLDADDRLLTSLQKLSLELQKEDPEEQRDVARLREVCARLIKYTVEGIRTKLDRTYLEALETAAQSSVSLPASKDEMSALQEELESLYAEILPVAQMSVEQQHLEPALNGVAAKNGNATVRSRKGVEYIQLCIEYLLQNLDTLSESVQAFQDHQAAAKSLEAMARDELDKEVQASPRKTRPVESPLRKRNSLSSRSAITPIRPGAASHSRHHSIDVSMENTPWDELFRAAVLVPASQEDMMDAHAVRDQAALLARTVGERRAKVQDVALNIQDSFESVAVSHMTDAKLAMQMVRDSVLAETPYGEVNLVDPEIDGSIAVLIHQLEETRAALEKAAADTTKAQGRIAKKEDLIRRWGQ